MNIDDNRFAVVDLTATLGGARNGGWFRRVLAAFADRVERFERWVLNR